MHKVVKANIDLGQKEAKYYDKIHSEIFNKYEQERLKSGLKKAVSKITSGSKKALDIGAGTGNITSKLLDMGFEVTAVDVSKDYLAVLKKKCPEANIICKEIDKVDFEKESFDMITTYSVLHHFPDYLKIVSKACRWLKKNGIIYLDHESVNNDNSGFNRLYRFSNGVLNVIKVCYFGGIKRKDIQFDFSVSDFHKTIDHLAIEKILRKNMRFVRKREYFNRTTHYWNPLSIIYRLINKEDSVLWVGKK